jgi:DNA-directed RNA polymerase specialized sigma24 family protein
MAESTDAFNELDQIRREIKQLNEKVDRVDANVERARVTQLGALATVHAAGSDVAPEMVLHSAGMSMADIAAALGKKEGAVRRAVNRAKQRQRKAS